jgi:purine-binding chemotaxis protein CheW
VRIRFRKPQREYNDRTCIVVVEIKDVSVGLIVDSVSEVMPIGDEDIVLPRELKSAQNRYIKGIGKVGTEVKLLLDCDRLLNDDEIDKISGAV